MISQTILAVLSGGIIGLLMGATGGGGSLIAIPLLVYVVGIPVQHATAMSLVVVGYSAAFGAWQQSRHGKVKGRAAVVFSSTGMIGAWLGAQGHKLVPADVILMLFGVLLLFISIWTLQARILKTDQHVDMDCAQHFSWNCAIKAIAIGFGIGLLTGFFGIGGGFVIVPALMFVLGFPIWTAVGTSFFIIALTSIGGIIGHLDVNHIKIELTGLVILGSILGMMLGTHMSKKMKERTLRQAFAILVGLIGLFIIIDNSLRLFA
ncbi:MAG: UPF0721 transmembrane protein [Nitrospirales bacterium]|nr:MAG: UPF0721 transmembrane protein [Nitrospirales bacterium]